MKTKGAIAVLTKLKQAKCFGPNDSFDREMLIDAIDTYYYYYKNITIKERIKGLNNAVDEIIGEIKKAKCKELLKKYKAEILKLKITPN